VLAWITPRQRRDIGGLLGITVFVGTISLGIPVIVGAGLAEDPHDAVILAFLLLAGSNLILTRRALVGGTRVASQIVTSFRRRVAEQTAALPLERFEALPHAAIRLALDDATRAIGEGIATASKFTIYLFCLLLTPVLVGALFPEILLPVLLFLGAVIAVVAWVFARLLRAEAEAGEAERRLDDLVADLVGGFQEVRLHAGRRAALVEDDIHPRIRAAAAARGREGAWASILFGLADLAPLLIAGGLVLVLPVAADDGLSDLAAAGLVILYLPMVIFMELPKVVRLVAAVHSLDEVVARLDREMEAAGSDRPRRGEQRSLQDALRLEGVTFRYPAEAGDRGFGIGPVDLEIRAGTLCFLTGGNGSGKSTIIKLLTGLYAPAAGRVTADGVPLVPHVDHGLFSAVLTDTHLFHRLYGYRDTAPEKLSAILARLEIDHRVAFADGAFSTTDLSTGQKKRLSLAVALVEDRPVLVLDEWAADQDPEFRAWFYRDFLPSERALGRTIVAATHDDRYFDVADMVVTVEDGQVIGVAAPDGADR